MSLRDKIKTIDGGQAIPDDVIVSGQAGQGADTQPQGTTPDISAQGNDTQVADNTQAPSQPAVQPAAGKTFTRGFAPVSREEDRPADTVEPAKQWPKPVYVADKKHPFKSVSDWLAKPEMSNKSKERMLIAMEAMRHLANLYYTNKGARPQNLNYNAVLDWEARQKGHKKEAEAKEAAEASAAAAAAKDKWNKDIAMAKLSLQSRDLDGKAAARAAKAENDGKRLALDAGYKSGQLTLGAERNKNAANHNKAMEGIARQRNAIAARNAATRAARSSGGRSGSGGGGNAKNSDEYIRGKNGTWYVGPKDKRKKLAAETYDMLIKEIPDAGIMEGGAITGTTRKKYPTEQEMWEVIQHYPSSKAYKHMVEAAGAKIQNKSSVSGSEL